ncbi:MAG TPA: hypothetical protein PLH19_08710, partial [Anaerolineae bacterium]|nr:hypothetical protein [Anaerolineae bacterium]HQH38597.1 hypothetical protein [Anaerolineae bacterium]
MGRFHQQVLKPDIILEGAAFPTRQQSVEKQRLCHAGVMVIPKYLFRLVNLTKPLIPYARF